MFKIAYPWAKSEEERAEREYIKARTETSEDEIAGNVWISPLLGKQSQLQSSDRLTTASANFFFPFPTALELAKEYKMFDWVRALLDSTEIIQSPASSKKPITPPPKFDIPPSLEADEEPAPSTRTRSRRSVSPTKSSPKKNASPRKARSARAAKESSAAATTAASASLQAALNGSVDSESVEESNEAAAAEQPETAEKEEKETKETKDVKDVKPKKSVRSRKQVSAPAADEKVKVNVESTTEVKDEVEVNQTNVSVEMPVSLPDLPPAEDTEQMIAQAKKMVEEATKLQEDNTAADAPAKKRKSDEVEEDEENTQTTAQPTKKARVLEDKLKKERVRNRALVGVTATLALA